jgi:drug/metabolite transporter (DMT)-like permease
LEIEEIPDNEEGVKSGKRMKELKINIEPISKKPAPLAFHILTWQRFSAPLSRALVQLAIQYSIVATFLFASKSGVNGGIISTIFSSSCIFTIVIFYFKYGHQISKVDAIGTCFILLCVVLIALGGTGGSSESTEVKSDEEVK